MPKWSKDATQFKVTVSYHKTRGYQAYLPRPIVEHLKIHEKDENDPKPITFTIKKNKVEITVSPEES